MSKVWRTLALLALSGAAATSPAAPNSHSLSQIATKAALVMQERAVREGFEDVEVSIRPLDTRLNLAACGQPLTTLPANSTRVLGPVSAGIRCDGPEPWTLYVRGQVIAQVEAPVLSVSVGRGELLSENDVVLQRRRISNDYGGYITELDDIIGKEAKRSLAAGSELRFSDLKAPIIVERGQTVSIVSGGAGLRVSMQGKALASGGAGDRILVANQKTGKRVEGVVAGNGSIMIQ